MLIISWSPLDLYNFGEKMPFTPLHKGPGILIKALLQGSFSLMVFGWAQIIMDIQPLLVILTGDSHLHGFSYTYIGASIFALVAGLSGKYLSEFGLIVIGVSKKDSPIKIVWRVVFVSAFIGTFSHVLLDSIMHSDVEPFYPFSQANNLVGLITLNQLHLFCLLTGLPGCYHLLFIAVDYQKQSATLI